MGLETGTYISDLVASNPLSGDPESQGDDHLRLIKSVLQATFPQTSKAFRFPTTGNAVASFTVSFPADQNKLFIVGVTANAVITLPTPTGVNADGFAVSFKRTDAPSITGYTARITHASIYGHTSAGYYPLERENDAVTMVWFAASGLWMPLPHRNGFEAGTTMLFHQNAAPLGWTKNTDINNNDRALRLVTGNVTVGGSTGFSGVFASRTITQANLPNITLTSGAQSIDHSHSFSVTTAADTSTSGGGSRVTGITAGAGFATSGVSTGHTHQVPLGGSGTAMDFAVKYIDMILATRSSG